jgi:polysaccharide pyruvyl transferase WcaK-like protein
MRRNSMGRTCFQMINQSHQLPQSAILHREVARVGVESMRLLIDSGTYNCQNLGDVAMLQVAISRLAKLAPAAQLQVITDVPEALVRHCPSAQPVNAAAFRAWFRDDMLLSRGQRYAPPVLASRFRGVKRYLRRRWPRSLRHAMVVTRPANIRADLDALIEAVYSADCVVLCGQGFLTDHVGIDALTKLGLLATAEAQGIPCVMFGQGIGPVSNAAILELARIVLPRVEFVSLRECVAGLPLCRSMQIASTKCCVTGDEAIELAYEQRKSAYFNALGINVRLSPSSGLTEGILPLLAAVLNKFARKRRLEYVPLPIARDHDLRDVRSIRELLGLMGYQSNGGADLETPEAVIAQASRCRIVLTGAYHAAVFALSQGIPAVCLAKSAYFRVKFEGLADQFGMGCVVVSLNDPHAEDRLFEALEWAWKTAPQLDEPLRRAAALQILKSYRVYGRLGRLLRGKFPRSEIAVLAPPKVAGTFGSLGLGRMYG